MDSPMITPGRRPARKRPSDGDFMVTPYTTIVMLGGMMGPSVAAEATTAVENSLSYPCFFIEGIKTVPRAEASATADPVIPDRNISATTRVWARPPRICPPGGWKTGSAGP